MIWEKSMYNLNITSKEFSHSRNKVSVCRNKYNNVTAIGVCHIKHFSRNLRINTFLLRAEHGSFAKWTLSYFMVCNTCT